MHPRLQQQIQQYLSNAATLPQEWQNFLNAINETYVSLDDERQQWASSVTQLTHEVKNVTQVSHQSTSDLQAILEAFPDLFFRLDANGTFLDYRSGAATKLYLPPEHFLNKTIYDVFPPTLAARFAATIQQALAAQDITSYEYSLPIGNTEEHFELRVIPISSGQVVAVVRDITERQQMETELRHQKLLFENLVKVARTTSAQPDLETTLQNVLDVATDLTRAQWGNLFLLTPTGEVSQAMIAKEASFHGNRLQIANRFLNEGLESWVVRHREAILIEDTKQDERWLYMPESEAVIRSALSIPIMNAGTLFGVLTLLHTVPGFFTEEHKQFMNAAADHIALALRNAQIFETQRQMTTRQFILYEVLRIAGEQHAPHQVMSLAVDAIARLTGWLNISISTPTDNGQKWVIQAASGELIPRIGATYSVEQGIIGRTLRTQQTQYASEVQHDPDYVPGQPTTRSELAVPIMRDDRLLGILDLQSERRDNFAPDDRLMAESVAGTVALALDNARLYSDAESHLAEISTLYTITQMMTQSLVLDDVLNTALHETRHALGYHKGVILLTDKDNGTVRIGAAHDLTTALQETLLNSEITQVCHIIRNTPPMIIIWPETPPQTAPISESLARAIRALGFNSWVCMPLLHHDQMLGTILLFDQQPEQTIRVTSRLVLALGHQIGTAIANAYLHEEVAFKQGQLRTLLDASRNGILLITLDGDIPFMNAAAYELLEVPSQAANWTSHSISENLLRLRHQHPHIVRSLINEIRRVRSGDESAGEGEWEIPNRVIQWSNLPVIDRGQYQGRLLIARDITEERRLARLREDLTQTMVHDLRNPLTSIAGAIEMINFELQNDGLDELPQMMTVIDLNTHKMLDLVNTIMDISRLESHQMPLRWAAATLIELVQEAFKIQTPLAREKNLQLVHHLPSDLPLVWADANLVARVLQNLIGNAIKFSPTDGTIAVAAAVQRQSRGADMIEVRVRDHGPGIAPDLRARLFQKFVTSRQKESGTGVGLAFCQMAVQAHGGRIWFENEPEGGATFHFTLPLFQLENEA